PSLLTTRSSGRSADTSRPTADGQAGKSKSGQVEERSRAPARGWLACATPWREGRRLRRRHDGGAGRGALLTPQQRQREQRHEADRADADHQAAEIRVIVLGHGDRKSVV